MGMYGAGTAFNLRYAQNSYQPPRTFGKKQEKIIVGGNSITNINITNGPKSGLLNFMSGLFGGLTGGNMFGGNMFGMGNMFGIGNMFGGGMWGFNNLGNYTSPFAAVNAANATTTTQTPEQEQAQQLANLKALFPNVTFVAEKDGKFSATKKDGTLINGKTYDEMKDTLGKPEAQGTGNEDPTLNGNGNGNGNVVNNNGNAGNGNGQDGDGGDGAGADVVQDTPGSVVDKARGSGNVTASDVQITGDDAAPTQIVMTDTSSGKTHKYTYRKLTDAEVSSGKAGSGATKGKAYYILDSVTDENGNDIKANNVEVYELSATKNNAGKYTYNLSQDKGLFGAGESSIKMP